MKIDQPHLNANYSMIDRTFGPTRIASESKKKKERKKKERKKETHPIMCSRRRNRLPLRSRSPLTTSGERTCPDSAKSPETGSQRLQQHNASPHEAERKKGHNCSLLIFGEIYRPYRCSQAVYLCKSFYFPGQGSLTQYEAPAILAGPSLEIIFFLEASPT